MGPGGYLPASRVDASDDGCSPSGDFWGIGGGLTLKETQGEQPLFARAEIGG